MDAHVKAQLFRFARMTAYGLAAQFLALGHWPGWSAAFSLAGGVAETTLREMLPVKAIPMVGAVLAPPQKPTAPQGGEGPKTS